jgi:membrane-bound lytic murein transglycosylase F
LKKSKCNRRNVSIVVFVTVIFLLFNSAIIPKNIEDFTNNHLQNGKTTKKNEVVNVLLFSKASDYFLYKGNPIGFQYELFKELEKALGKEVCIMIESDINLVRDAILSNNYDIVAVDFKENSLLDYYQTFSIPHSTTYPVLVGRKEVQTDTLNHAEIVVSSFAANTVEKDSLPQHATWNIISKEVLIEDIFEEVQNGDADFLICDYNEAVTMLTFCTDLRIIKQVGMPYDRKWRFTGQDKAFHQKVNEWIEEFKQSKKYERLCQKYFTFQSPVIAQSFHKSKYSKISPFDAIIRYFAEKADLDWRFLASVIFQESKFQSGLIGIGGSFGVMQLMPATGASYGVGEESSLDDQLFAGSRYLNKLRDVYKDVPDKHEQLKFVAGAYNSGPGHINDAQRLCAKYGKNPLKWDDVAYYLTLKNRPKYYNDEEVNHGYYPGKHTVKYVAEVMERYVGYKAIAN